MKKFSIKIYLFHSYSHFVLRNRVIKGIDFHQNSLQLSQQKKLNLLFDSDLRTYAIALGDDEEDAMARNNAMTLTYI